MAEVAANPAVHFTMAHLKGIGLPIPQHAVSRKPRLRPWVGRNRGITYPLGTYAMWRGNHWSYRYNQSTAATWGEGETHREYHQHYAHAKDAKDYGRAGREFEYLSVKRGRLDIKPLPKVQYVPDGAKPKWLWKSWHGAMNASDMWQREVVYDEHIPEHLGCKRPLSVLAPSTYHGHLHLMHMEKVTITVCPFLFGFGDTMQKTVLDFYRRALSARSPFPKDKVFLFYSIDFVTPTIEVTWLDGTTYAPPMLEGNNSQSLIQMIMEQGWLAQDRMEAAGRTLQPLAIDDYKWEQLITFKKIRDKDAVKNKKK
jgi:hypothetical protein